MLRAIHRLFDHPLIFNSYQVLADGGKGRAIRRFLQDLPYDSVLDIGCGTGNWAKYAPGRYLGVDPAPAFISAAIRRYAGDPKKKFLVADPTSQDVPGEFDLAQLVSVLHHLSDDDVSRLLERIRPRVRHLFILDLYPMPWNPPARFLYASDRGSFIRTPEQQQRLVLDGEWRLVKEGSYFAPTLLYRHTLFLFERAGLEVGG